MAEVKRVGVWTRDLQLSTCPEFPVLRLGKTKTQNSRPKTNRRLPRYPGCATGPSRNYPETTKVVSIYSEPTK